MYEKLKAFASFIGFLIIFSWPIVVDAPTIFCILWTVFWTILMPASIIIDQRKEEDQI
jgi:hypothetical protein